MGPRFELRDAFLPLLLEYCRATVLTTILQGEKDLGVREGREGQSASLAHIGGQIAARDLSERRDQLEQPMIGALLEQDAVPLVLEVQAAGHVAPGLLQPAIEGEEPRPTGFVGSGRQPQREGLEDPEDGADLAKLDRTERTDAEAAPHGCIEDAFPDEAEQSFADRGPANAELEGEGRIPYARASGEVAALDLSHDGAIDLVAEGDTRDHLVLTKCIGNYVFRIQYTQT